MKRALENDFLNMKKEFTILESISLHVTDATWRSYYEPGTKKIFIGTIGRTKSVLMHEIRHALIDLRYPLLSKFLSILRALTCSYLLFPLVILARFAMDRNPEVADSIRFYSFITYLILLIPVWIEELDANLFSYIHSRKISTAIVSQLSYTIPYFFIYYL